MPACGAACATEPARGRTCPAWGQRRSPAKDKDKRGGKASPAWAKPIKIRAGAKVGVKVRAKVGVKVGAKVGVCAAAKACVTASARSKACPPAPLMAPQAIRSMLA